MLIKHIKNIYHTNIICHTIYGGVRFIKISNDVIEKRNRKTKMLLYIFIIKL